MWSVSVSVCLSVSVSVSAFFQPTPMSVGTHKRSWTFGQLGGRFEF